MFSDKNMYEAKVFLKALSDAHDTMRFIYKIIYEQSKYL